MLLKWVKMSTVTLMYVTVTCMLIQVSAQVVSWNNPSWKKAIVQIYIQLKHYTGLKVSSLEHLYSTAQNFLNHGTVTQHINHFPLLWISALPWKKRSIKPNQLKFVQYKTAIITQKHVTFPLSPLRISRAWEEQSHTAVTRHPVSRVLWKSLCLPITRSRCQTISTVVPLCFVPPAKASYTARLKVSVFTARHTLLCDIKPEGL